MATTSLFIMGVFECPKEVNYSSETKAFKSDKYTCDLYLEYDNETIVNISLIDCIKRLD